MNAIEAKRMNSPFACLADSFVDGKGKVCHDVETSHKPQARAIRDQRVVDEEFFGSRRLRAQIQLNEAQAEIRHLDRTAIRFHGAIRTAKFKKRVRLMEEVPKLEKQIAEFRLEELEEQENENKVNGLTFSCLAGQIFFARREVNNMK